MRCFCARPKSQRETWLSLKIHVRVIFFFFFLFIIFFFQIHYCLLFCFNVLTTIINEKMCTLTIIIHLQLNFDYVLKIHLELNFDHVHIRVSFWHHGNIFHNLIVTVKSHSFQILSTHIGIQKGTNNSKFGDCCFEEVSNENSLIRPLIKPTTL